MAQAARLKISETAVLEDALPVDDYPNQFAAGIRVSAHSYLTVVFLTIFFTAFFVYLEEDLIAALLSAFGFIIIPFLAFTDRIVFDGETLRRTGLIPRLWNALKGAPQFLKLTDIEQIETQAFPALERGGNVLYRYRTSVKGVGETFVFASSERAGNSGGEDYRRMIRKLFAGASVDTLDNRSIELRDYLSKPKETLLKAACVKLPSSEVLENSLNEFREPNRRRRQQLSSRRMKTEISEKEIQKADYLRRLANELRLSGNLLQSLEAFRRALLLNPSDAWMTFEFARSLHSYASAERSEKLKRKAKAALRLAEIRAGDDGELLSARRNLFSIRRLGTRRTDVSKGFNGGDGKFSLGARAGGSCPARRKNRPRHSSFHERRAFC